MVTAGLAGSDLPLLSGLVFPLSDRITLSGNILHLQGTLHPKVILKINYKRELKAPPHTVSCGHWTLGRGGRVRCQVKEVSKIVGIGSILGFGVKGTVT